MNRRIYQLIITNYGLHYKKFFYIANFNGKGVLGVFEGF